MEPINVSDFEALAREKLSQMAYDYYASGAMDEITLRENDSWFDQVPIYYKVLTGVGNRDMSTTLLGHKISMPILVAATAFHQMAHPDGEVATAKAAGAANTIMLLSTISNRPVEEVLAAATGPVFFQLYIYKDRGMTVDLVRRIEAAGCKAILMTADSPLLGRRERDVRNGFALPQGLIAGNLMGTGMQEVNAGPMQSGLAKFISDHVDPNLTWDDLDWLRSITKLPVLVKGLVRADDAKRSLEYGAAGVVVSNHGGRQLDTSPSTFRALPAIADAIGGKGEIIFDGGVRRGTDVLKALAYGVTAVSVGRPVLWGLAAMGQEGVSRVLSILREEFDLAMALAGTKDIKSITRDLVTSPYA